MKKFFYLAAVLVFITNCSSPETVKSNVNVANADITVVNQTNANINQPTANVETQTETNAIKLRDSMALSKENFELGKTKKGGDAEPIKAITPLTSAPDDSVITTTMNAQSAPIETRTFKNNPMLLKVEKILADVKKPQYKVYLKNGKVVELAPGTISNSATASANEILMAAGAIPKNAPQKNETKAEIEKSEQ